MKKSIVSLLAVVFAIVLCMATLFGLTGCSDDNPTSEPIQSSVQHPEHSDKTSESESDSDSAEEPTSDSTSESTSESVHTHKFEENADNAFLKSEATCTKKAEYYLSCACGEKSTRYFEYGDYAPHDEVIDEAVNPTCVSSGLTEGKHCSKCFTVIIEQQTIPALDHNLISYKEKAATCTEKGYAAYEKCTRCDYTTYRELPALGHDYVSHKGVASTCTKKGYADYETCSRCDYSTYRELPLAEHILNNGFCQNCGQEITPHNHIEVIDQGTPATCLSQGLTDGKHCSICNKVLEEQTVIPALGHNEISHNGKAATCLESGYEAYVTCSRCTYTTYREIPALGHNLISHNGKAATCTEAGYEAYDTCSRCTYSTYKEIPALGHDEISHSGKEATCLESGYAAYETCSRCNYTTYIEIPALGHNYVNGKCSRCNDIEPTNLKYFTFTLLADDTYSIKVKDEYKSSLPIDIRIPSIYNGKAVTEIGENAFYNCQYLANIIFSSNITSIGDDAINRHRDFSFFLDSGAAFIVTPLL